LLWYVSYRADPRAKVLADRHYNRQNPNSPNFVPPASCLVLLTKEASALWVTLTPIAGYVRHQWAGAWTCTLFRNESEHLSSELIRQAVAASLHKYGEPPALGFITFIDRSKTRPKKDPGYCYIKAGWKPCGKTKSGLYALQLLPKDMPEPEAPLSFQLKLALA
jgi:hypothetical protein